MFSLQPVTLIDRIKSAKVIAAATAPALDYSMEELMQATNEEFAAIITAKAAHAMAIAEIEECTTVLSN